MSCETWILLDSSGFGGIESHVAELAAGLREAGRAPRVLLLQDHGPHPLAARLAADQVPLEVLSGGFAALWRRLRSGRPAVLHTHGYKANLLGRLAARLTGTRCVASFHAGERPPGLLALYDAADRWTSGLGPRIAVSRPILARLPWGGTLVPNFVALPPEPPGGTPLTVAFVGRLSPEKGPDLFAELSRLAPGPDYQVFGDGPMRQAIASPGLVLHGARPGMGGAWGGIGLLAITSRAEGLPLAALEAMAHGVPVAAFGLGGLPELISEGENGFLAQPGDLPALAAAVGRWAAMDRAARRAMGDAARATIAQRHSREAGVAQIIRVYDGAA
ncbi:MAG: glycosyltransferase family 4 protein [Roseococcus sp.]|nr:glycosyltransferase family 4 protein [Roseococcus sp.]